jgi:hypothetical protein
LKEKSKKKELKGMVLKGKKERERKRGEGRTSFFAILLPKIHG